MTEQVNQKLSDTDYQIAFLQDNINTYKLESEKLEWTNDKLKRDLRTSEQNLDNLKSETKSNVMQFIQDNDNDQMDLKEKLEKIEKTLAKRDHKILKL